MGMFKNSGGGGYLKGISATLLGITFDSKVWNEGKPKEYSTISATLAFQPDGATAPIKTFIPAGFFYPDNQTISDDKTTVSSDRDGAVLAGDSDFARFIESIEAIDPSVFEGADGRSFPQVAGLRVTFDRKVNEALTASHGKRSYEKKDGTKGEAPRDYLVVSAVLGKVAVKGGKAAAAPKAAAAAKSSKTAAAKPVVDAVDTDAALLAIIEAASGKVERKVMGSKVTRYRLNNNLDEAAGEALRTKLMSDEYINDAVKRGVIDLDGGTITAAA
jgi:hypothetical protein